jgi:hypothetical protein
MKKLIIAAAIMLAISCQKETTTARLISTQTNDTSFIKKEVVKRFSTPEAGFRIDYFIDSCSSAELKYNTNDGKGWKPYPITVKAYGGDLFFLQYFRYKWIITRYDGSIWESSERIFLF